MKIFIKQISGKTIPLDVDPNADIVNVAILAYQMRAKSQENATLEDYATAINLLFAGRNLAYDKKLADYGIKELSTLHEVGKSFTMSPGFDWGTLTIIDVASQTACENPYILNPGCAHTHEKSSLKAWIETKLRSHETPNCPCCRASIATLHVAKLTLWQPPAPASTNHNPTVNQTSSPSQK